MKSHYKKHIFIYLQSLLGIGHQQRIALLSQVLSKAGHDVTIANGSRHSSLIDFHGRTIQLPILCADKQISHLVDGKGNTIDDDWKVFRKNRLLKAFQEANPDILLTESFPFGRRQLRFELIPLLEMARSRLPKPLIACSIRDILQAKKNAARIDEVVEWVNDYYDLVLVHGDPRFLPLESSFAAVSKISDKIRYTGYVVGHPGGNNGKKDLALVAAGGAGYQTLYQSVIEMIPALNRHRKLTWHLYLGDQISVRDKLALQRRAAENLLVKNNSLDFRRELKCCRVIISQAGYNTTMEILANRVRAVLLPYQDQGETEQRIRCQRLVELGLARVIDDPIITAESLQKEVQKALQFAPAKFTLNIRGAESSVRLLTTGFPAQGIRYS